MSSFHHLARAVAARAGQPPPVLNAPPLIAYADGSGTIASLPAGCGVSIYEDNGRYCLVEASWFLGRGTNNYAELSAVRVALWITDTEPFRDRPLIVRTDSMYAIQQLDRPDPPGMHVKNAEVIRLTRLAMVGRVVLFEHVRGHSGVEGNVRADKLAGLARRRGVAAMEARARAALTAQGLPR